MISILHGKLVVSAWNGCFKMHMDMGSVSILARYHTRH